MNAGYHLLQFVPDPFMGTAITFGALVEGPQGWRFTLAAPGERLLPPALPRAATTLFRAVIAELESLSRPRLPISVGQHVRLAERVDVPAGVEDAMTWVSSFVLPRAEQALAKERRHQRTRRATIGRLFLKQHHVSKFVRSHFKPEQLGASARLVKPVSHFVQGTLETLLLEPVFLDSDRFDDELQDVASTLLAWTSIARQKHRENLQFSVYALGNSVDHLRLVREGFGDSPIRVIDTNEARACEHFFQSIKAAASSMQLDS